MTRFFLPFILFLACVFILGALIAYFAYGASPKRDGQLIVAGLQNQTGIQWNENNAILIEAEHREDVFTALGYAHAADHSWLISLLKKAGKGELADWFGTNLLELDKHARLLGFHDLARETYVNLAEQEQAVLDAYARGINAAFSQQAVQQSEEFVHLDIEPEEWSPWDALTIERLLAWVGTQRLVPSDSTFHQAAQSDSALIRFAADDEAFRSFLHLGGFEHSRSWTAAIADSTSFYHQFVFGDTALQMIQEVLLRLSGEESMVATIPGTLLFPFGKTGNEAWSVFLTSRADIVPTNTQAPPPLFDRLVDDNGTETLLTFPRSSAGLYFKAEPPGVPVSADPEAIVLPGDSLALPPPDSLNGRPESSSDLVEKSPPAWLIQWQGFSPGTDLTMWFDLLWRTDIQPSFTLLKGNGVSVSRTGVASVLGTPEVVLCSESDIIFVTESSQANVVEIDSNSRNTSDWYYSDWAASILPSALEALGHRDSLASSLKDPYAFLNGWKHEFGPESIGASIFDLWMERFRATTGHFPSAEPDSIEFGVYTSSLRKAVDGLIEEHGERPSNWRWMLIQSSRRFFPVWSDSLTSSVPSRYNISHASVGGHPSSFFFGPSVSIPSRRTSSSWMAHVSTANWNNVFVRDKDHSLDSARRPSPPTVERIVHSDTGASEPLVLVPAE